MTKYVLSACLSGLIGWSGFAGVSALAQGRPRDADQQQHAASERLVGIWSLTDNNNVLFNLVLNADGTSLTVSARGIHKRHLSSIAINWLNRDDGVVGAMAFARITPAGGSTPYRLVLRVLCNGLSTGADLNASPSTTAKRSGCKVQSCAGWVPTNSNQHRPTNLLTSFLTSSSRLSMTSITSPMGPGLFKPMAV